jgi:hypothetical protein
MVPTMTRVVINNPFQIILRPQGLFRPAV